jgi:hypothetical protein
MNKVPRRLVAKAALGTVAAGIGAVLQDTRAASTATSDATRNTDAALAQLAARAYGVDILRHGADAGGRMPSDDALDAAITEAASGQGGLVYIPAGTFLFTRPHVISRQRLHLFGAGQWATTLLYRPTTDYSSFITFRNGAAVYNEGSLRDLTIFSDDITRNKTAIEAVDTSALSIRQVRIAGMRQVGDSWVWGGGRDGSIALRLRGREATEVSDFYAYADRPIVIDKNPNVGSAHGIDSDHTHFHNLYLFANGHPCVLLASGLNLTQMSFGGYQAWVGGTHGFQWLDTGSQQISASLHFQNVRVEQGTDPAASSFYIQRTGKLAMLSFSQVKTDVARRGFYLRGCDDVRFDSVLHDGQNLALDIDASVRRVSAANCFWQTGSTASLAGQRLVWSTPKNPNNGALPPNFVLDEIGNSVRNAEADAQLTGSVQTVARTAELSIGVDGTLGFMTIDTHENVGAIFHLNGTARSVTRSLESAPGFFSATKDTPGQINVYWDKASARYVLQNLRPVDLRLRLGRFGGSYTAF